MLSIAAANHRADRQGGVRSVRVAVLLALLALSASAAPTPAAAMSTAGPEQLAYTLDARATANGQLAGSLGIAFTNTGTSALSEVWLRLWGNGPAGCRPQRVKVTVLSGGTAASPERNCTALRVQLATPLAAGQRGALQLRVQVRLPRDNDRFGFANGASYYGDGIPVVAPLRDGQPDLDSFIALGDPFLISAAAWRTTLTWPAGLAAAVTGARQAASAAPAGWQRATFDAASARDFMIAVGPWRATRTSRDGTQITVLAPRSLRGAAMLRAAASAFHSFTSSYGSAEESDLYVVLTPGLISQGMEYSGVVLSEPDPETVVHEVAHQWFSQLVGSDGWRTPWLDETLTTYAEMRQLGNLPQNCDLERPFADYGRARLSWTLADFDRDPQDVYGAIYDGGACAFAALDEEWGGTRFPELLRAYVAQYRHGLADTAGFIAMLRAAAPSDYDVDAFLTFARLTS